MKERIIEESIELFTKYGIKSTTMDDIAKNMGISKRTIYENFKDKEDLLIACISMFISENEKFTCNVFNKSENVLEAIMIVLQKGAEQARKQQYFIMDELKKYYPKVYKNFFLCPNDDKQQKMEELITRGINEGVFREELNPEIIAIVFSRQAEGFTINNENLDKYSLLEIFENMVLAFLRGLCTSKGIEIYDRLIERHKLN